MDETIICISASVEQNRKLIQEQRKKERADASSVIKSPSAPAYGTKDLLRLDMETGQMNNQDYFQVDKMTPDLFAGEEQTKQK